MNTFDCGIGPEQLKDSWDQPQKIIIWSMEMNQEPKCFMMGSVRMLMGTSHMYFSLFLIYVSLLGRGHGQIPK